MTRPWNDVLQAPRGGRNKKKRPRKGRPSYEEEEEETDGGGLSTADLDVHLDVIYQGLGEPLDSSGKVERLLWGITPAPPCFCTGMDQDDPW